MKTRILTGSLFAVVMLLLFALLAWQPLLTPLLMLLLAFFCFRELSALLPKKPSWAAKSLTVLSLLLIPLPAYSFLVFPYVLHFPFDNLRFAFSLFFLGGYFLLFFLLCLPLLVLSCLRRGPTELPSIALCAGLLFYLVFPLSLASLLPIVGGLKGWSFLLLAFFAPWASDVFAFFAGSFWGKRKLIPAISPKKTVAGFLGGCLGCLLLLWGFALAYHSLISPLRWSLGLCLFLLVFGLLLGMVSQLGDWFASLLKRLFDLKDFGTLLPGHGGLMDRFDSVFFTLPFVYVAAFLFFMFFT